MSTSRRLLALLGLMLLIASLALLVWTLVPVPREVQVHPVDLRAPTPTSSSSRFLPSDSFALEVWLA